MVLTNNKWDGSIKNYELSIKTHDLTWFNQEKLWFHQQTTEIWPSKMGI